MGEQVIASRYNDIKKSVKDDREFRGLLLKNRLKILLVSDPNVDMAAAAMDVAVGYLHDPWDMPGTAHFCEHMLFLGTEKYPSENEYTSFIAANGGMSNAATYTDHTNYHFKVKCDQLLPTLDRFIQFFLTPHFTESATKREMLNVDSEHQNHLKTDWWRISQVEKFLSKPGHDYCKFGTGTKEILGQEAKAKGIDPRETLLKFHNTWYSSNIMSLVIVGKESLDTLEDYVLQLEMNKIPDKNVEMTFWEHPYGDEQLKKRVDIVPVKDIRTLKVSFRVPYMDQEYRSKPGVVVGHYLGHEGEGSLLAALKVKGWASSLDCRYDVLARGFAMVDIEMTLSKDGFNHVDDIVEMTFGYIGLLRREVPHNQEWIYDELREIYEMDFTFEDRKNPYLLAKAKARNLQRVPFEEILSHSFLISEYKPELVRNLIDCLRPENMFVEVVAKKNLERASSTPMTKEPVYGTDIRIEQIPQETLQRFSTAMNIPNTLFHLPKKNEYIPKKFELKPIDNEATGDPKLMHTDPYLHVWFRQDNEFNYPKMHIEVDVYTPLFSACPRSSFMSILLLKLYDDSLGEWTYSPKTAGIEHSTSYGYSSFRIKTSGYDEKQPIFMKKLVAGLIQFEPDKGRFEVVIDNLIRSLDSHAHDQPHLIAQECKDLLLVMSKWSKKQLLEAGAKVTFEEMREHKKMLLEAFHITLFVHGNATKEEAIELGKSVQELFQNAPWNHRPVYHNEAASNKELALEYGKPLIYRHFQSTHSNSAVGCLFQIGTRNEKDLGLLQLLVQILREPIYNALRTVENLGYTVWTYSHLSCGTMAIKITVQGSADPDYVMSRIEAALERERTGILELKQEEFTKHVEAIIARLLEKPTNLKNKHTELWNHILNRYYCFDSGEIRANLLKEASKEDIINFFDTKIRKNGPERRLLAIYVHGSADRKETVAEKLKNGEILHDYTEVECMEAVRETLSIFAPPKQAVSVPPIGISPLD